MPALRIAALALAALATAATPPLPAARDVLAVMNRLRADPAGFADDLAAVAATYRGTVWLEDDGTAHGSIEGRAAVEAAAAAMRGFPPAAPLILDPVLTAAARAHVAAQGPTGAVGHASGAGATPGLRVLAAGGDVYVSEVIAYAMHDAEDVVRSLVVDDGLAGRGHRRMLLAAGFRYAGIACGRHSAQGTMCVIDLAATPGGRVALPVR